MKTNAGRKLIMKLTPCIRAAMRVNPCCYLLAAAASRSIKWSSVRTAMPVGPFER
jgi:hypothetical protein